MTSHPISLLRREWAASAGSVASRRALAALAAAEPLVDAVGAVDLGGLVEVLSARSGRLAPLRAAETLSAMVRSQGVDGLVARAVVQALLPGLLGLGGRFRWGASGPWYGDGDLFAGDLLATAWEVVTGVAGRDVKVPRLLDLIGWRLRNLALADARRVARLDWRPVELLPDRPGVSGSVLEDLASALDGVAGRVVSRRGAAVVYAHRVLGLTMAEVAALGGATRKQADHWRTNTERQLCAS